MEARLLFIQNLSHMKLWEWCAALWAVHCYVNLNATESLSVQCRILFMQHAAGLHPLSGTCPKDFDIWISFCLSLSSEKVVDTVDSYLVNCSALRWWKHAGNSWSCDQTRTYIWQLSSVVDEEIRFDVSWTDPRDLHQDWFCSKVINWFNLKVTNAALLVLMR